MSTTTEKFAALLEEESQRHTQEAARILGAMLTVEDIVKQTGREPDNIRARADGCIITEWVPQKPPYRVIELQMGNSWAESYPLTSNDPVQSVVTMLRDDSA